MTSNSAEEVLVNVKDFIAYFGPLKVIKIDRGNEFDNKTLRDFCEK